MRFTTTAFFAAMLRRTSSALSYGPSYASLWQWSLPKLIRQVPQKRMSHSSRGMHLNNKALLGAVILCLSAAASAGPVFSSASYNATTTFVDGGVGATTMTLAFDGSNYYTATGGYQSSPIVKYDANGNFVASTSPTPSIDFRSIFTNSANELLARGCCDASNGKTIYKQTSFGNFSAYVTLGGTGPDFQSAVVLNSAGTEYISRTGTAVKRWDLTGNQLASVTLNNSGVANANGYPFDRGIAAADGYWLTFVNQTVYAWDETGDLLDSASLIASGNSGNSGFSYSFANDKFWVVDTSGSTWLGYDIGLTNNPSNSVPLPGTLALVLLGLVAAASAGRRTSACVRSSKP